MLKAARALAERVDGLKVGRFELDKDLPVAAGLGGGSSDAAAALRLLARANDLSLDDERVRAAARATGADVPVCLDPKPRMMRGIGEILSAPLALPELAAVLVNPGVAVPTKDVFAALAAPALATPSSRMIARTPPIRRRCVEPCAQQRNDLEAPAIRLQPVIADVLAALRAQAGCQLARMSGSGATCFGLFCVAARRAGRRARSRQRAIRPGGCRATDARLARPCRSRNRPPRPARSSSPSSGNSASASLAIEP